MPNALQRSRARKNKKTPVDETPTTEYDSEGSTDTDTNTTETNKENDMSDENWTYNESEGQGGVDTMEREEESNEVGLPDFAAMVEDAPPDYTPQRASAGRKREASPFDAIVVAAKGQGWKRVPYQGEDQAKLIKRQLQKAQHFADLGMDLNTTDTHVEFNVRDKQPRTRKTATNGGNGQIALDTAAAEDGIVQDNDDRDE